MFKSIDAGGVWAAVDTSGLTGSISTLVIDPADSNTLYAGNLGAGILKSVDGGASWSISLLVPTIITSLTTDPRNPGTVYAGTFTNGLFKTTNGGQTWLFVFGGGNIFAVALDPIDSATLYESAFDEGGGFVFKITAGGQSSSTVIFQLKDLFGRPVSIRALAVDPVNSGTVYAGTFGLGVLKTTDGGKTWSNISSGITNSHILAITIDSTNPETLYVATWGAGVFKSTDGGATWQPTGAN